MLGCHIDSSSVAKYAFVYIFYGVAEPSIVHLLFIKKPLGWTSFQSYFNICVRTVYPVLYIY